MDLKSIGRRIAELRKAHGLTQEAFAETAELNYRHFQKIESGSTDFKVGTLLKIVKRLDSSPAALFDGEAGARLPDKQYRFILEHVPHGIQVNDLQGIITYSNPAHRLVHGYTNKELIGKKAIWDLCATDVEREELKNYFPKLLTGKMKIVPYVVRNRRKDGKIVEVRVDWRYLYDNAGKLIGFISGIVPTHG